MFATFTFDASAIANLGTVIAQMQELGFTLAHIDASAPAPAPAPVSVSVASAPTPEVAPTREYAPVHDVRVTLVLDGTGIRVGTYADGDKAGKYVGESGIRKACNAHLRATGGAWNADRKAYVYKSKKAAQDAYEVLAEDGVILIKASEWQEQRDRAAARKSKRA